VARGEAASATLVLSHEILLATGLFDVPVESALAVTPEAAPDRSPADKLAGLLRSRSPFRRKASSRLQSPLQSH
jgi:hypothetical protein